MVLPVVGGGVDLELCGETSAGRTEALTEEAVLVSILPVVGDPHDDEVAARAGCFLGLTCSPGVYELTWNSAPARCGACAAATAAAATPAAATKVAMRRGETLLDIVSSPR